MKRSANPNVKQIMDELSRYGKTTIRIRRLEQRLETLEARITSTGSPTISDMPKGGTPPAMEDLIVEKVELEERIKRLKGQNQNYREDALEKIDLIIDPVQNEIVERYYIDGESFEAIAGDMSYSERHVERLLQDGIEYLVNIL